MHFEEERIKEMLGEASVPAAAGDAPAQSFGLAGYPLAIVYAPLQAWQGLYDTDTALKKGTLFAELDKPFLGSKGGANGKL